MENLTPVRAVLIGVSGYAGNYLRMALEEVARGGLELIAATVINPAEVPEKCLQLQRAGCDLFEDYGEMLRACRGRFDLCLVPTAIGWHVPMTLAALAAGASVLVEKPLAGDLEGVHAIQAAERLAPGRFVAVGFQDIYQPGIRRLKEELLRQRIGGLRRIRLKACWPRGTRYYGRTDWAGRLEYQGQVVNDSPLNNAFAHFVNLALFLAGPSFEESAGTALADVELYRANPIESFDTAAVRARLSTGAEFFAAVTHAGSRDLPPTLLLEGERGEARWEYRVGWTITTRQGEHLADGLEPAGEPLRTMFRQVLRRTRDPGAFVCHTDIARRHTELVDALHRRASIQTVPARFLKEEPLEDQRLLSIERIDEAIEMAFSRTALFREAGWAWTRESA